ncbi:MAG: hypothetical protein DIU52_009060 [bacterium]|jgi:predicted Zn-dependent peptidase
MRWNGSRLWWLPLAAWWAVPGSGVAAQPRAAAGPDAVLGPVHVARPALGPLVVVREQPESRLVALRLAVRVEEPQGLEGAARVVVELARAQLEAAAAAVGGRASVERTTTHAVFRVVGPADAFERLAAALRLAAAGPAGADVGQSALAAARVVAEAQAAAELDTPEPLVRAKLREALFPELGSVSGRGVDLAGLTAERLARWWSATATASRSAVVVAGGVEAGRAVAAFEGWPVRAGRGGRAGAAAARGEGPPAQAATPRPPAPQVVTRWVALGYPATGEDPAVLAVAAALLAEELGQSGLGGASAELWWNAGRRALVLLAPEPPGRNGDGDGSVRQRLERAVAAVAEGVDAAAVARARRRAVRDVLFAARSAEGLAEVLGTMLDRTGEPNAALEFVAALERVGAHDVAHALQALRETRPEVAEVAP